MASIHVSQPGRTDQELSMDSTPPEHPLLIMAQYIRDFSFENPNAPEVYPTLSDQPPEITVNIDVIPAQLSKRTYEIVFTVRVKAGSKLNFQIRALASHELPFLKHACLPDGSSVHIARSQRVNGSVRQLIGPGEARSIKTDR